MGLALPTRSGLASSVWPGFFKSGLASSVWPGLFGLAWPVRSGPDDNYVAIIALQPWHKSLFLQQMLIFGVNLLKNQQKGVLGGALGRVWLAPFSMQILKNRSGAPEGAQGPPREVSGRALERFWAPWGGSEWSGH